MTQCVCSRYAVAIRIHFRMAKPRGPKRKGSLLQDGVKRCSGCEEDKIATDFSRCATAVDGLQRRCKQCQWSSNLKCLYGITLEQYRELEEAQGHKCACCGRPKEQCVIAKGNNWYVDHCHKTGRYRGLVCFKCNIAISIAEDPERVTAAFAYLKNYEEIQGKPNKE